MTGCSNPQKNQGTGTTLPATIDLTQHQGVYLSTDNSRQLVAVIKLKADDTIDGNTYATLAEAQAVIADGYVLNAGPYTGTFRGSYGYTDPQSPTHVNLINFALQWNPEGGKWTNEVDYGSAYFDASENLVEVAAGTATDPPQMSGQWMKQ